MNLILAILVVALGIYTTYLHTRERKHEFYRALFEATWEATWDHCDDLVDIHAELLEYMHDIPYTETATIKKVDLVLDMFEFEIKHMQGILNCEASADICITLEGDEDEE